MWIVVITTPTGITATASAVTRADARAWGRQYSRAGDTVTITAPVSRPAVSLVKAA